MQRKDKPFDGVFHESSQEQSLSNTLLALVDMILSGPSIKDQTRGPRTPATLAIAQLLRYNSVKHRRPETDHVASCRL